MKVEQQGRGGAVPVGKETLQLPLSSVSPAFVTRLLKQGMPCQPDGVHTAP